MDLKTWRILRESCFQVHGRCPPTRSPKGLIHTRRQRREPPTRFQVDENDPICAGFLSRRWTTTRRRWFHCSRHLHQDTHCSRLATTRNASRAPAHTHKWGGSHRDRHANRGPGRELCRCRSNWPRSLRWHSRNWYSLSCNLLSDRPQCTRHPKHGNRKGPGTLRPARYSSLPTTESVLRHGSVLRSGRHGSLWKPHIHHPPAGRKRNPRASWTLNRCAREGSMSPKTSRAWCS